MSLCEGVLTGKQERRGHRLGGGDISRRAAHQGGPRRAAWSCDRWSRAVAFDIRQLRAGYGTCGRDGGAMKVRAGDPRFLVTSRERLRSMPLGRSYKRSSRCARSAGAELVHRASAAASRSSMRGTREAEAIVEVVRPHRGDAACHRAWRGGGGRMTGGKSW